MTMYQRFTMIYMIKVLRITFQKTEKFKGASCTLCSILLSLEGQPVLCYFQTESLGYSDMGIWFSLFQRWDQLQVVDPDLIMSPTLLPMLYTLLLSQMKEL